MITKQEITEILGPVQGNWTFTELSVERGLNGQFRALVETKVAKRLVSPNGKGSGMLSQTSGGLGSTPDAAILAAIEVSLMWMGVLPEVAKVRGVQSILDALGPVGFNWGFSLKESITIATHGGSVRNTVDVFVKKSAIAYDGKGKGEITRTEHGYSPIKVAGSLAPEEEATTQAIKQAMSWLCIINYDHESAATVDEPTQTSASKPKGKGLIRFATVLSVFGLKVNLL